MASKFGGKISNLHVTLIITCLILYNVIIGQEP